MPGIKAIDGLPVIDAKRPLKFTVSPVDIASADPKDPSHCAAVQALVRECNAYEARVHLSRVYVRTSKSTWVRYQTPTNMRAEIIAFDRGGAFEPQQFELYPCRPGVLPTGKQMGSKSPGQHSRPPPKHPRRPYTTIKNVRTGPA